MQNPPANRKDPPANRMEQNSFLQWKKIPFFSRFLIWSGWGKGPFCLDTVRCRAAALLFFDVLTVPAYTRSKPKIIGAPLDLADEVNERLVAGPVKPPDGAVAFFRDATLAACGIVLTADKRMVSESFINTELWKNFGCFTRDNCADPVRISLNFFTIQKRFSGDVYVVVKQAYDANYGHWLFECLPRVGLIARCADISKCKFIVSAGHGAMQTIYIDSLACFGIKPEQIISIGYEEIHVDEMLYPLPLTSHPWVYSPFTIEFLEDIGRTVANDGNGPKRIYVSRKLATSRRLLNEEAVLEIVRANGFEVFYPESTDFRGQIRAFQNAELVVGVYGANLSNVVFAPRGVALLALTSERMQDDFFWDVVSLKEGRYMSLHGKASVENPDLHADFTIDIDIFRALLDECLLGAAHTTGPSVDPGEVARAP